MIRIECLPLGPLQTNAYLLYEDETKHAVVIDPGMNPGSLLRRLEGWHVDAILLTHAHFDHIGGVEAVRKKFGCPVYLHPLEQDWLLDPMKNGSGRWPDLSGPITCEPAEYDLDDRQTLELLGQKFKVIHTPGHSPGSVSFVFDQVVICGDVLFKRGVGRTDLPGGNIRNLMDSIQMKLFKLPSETKVWPGHGPATTIGDEQELNPYLQ